MRLTEERQKEIDEIINGILLSSGVSFPEDSMGDLLDKQGILYSVSAELPKEYSGVIFFRENKPFIAVNKADSLKRKVFSLAHEFGHFILHPMQEGKKYRIDGYKYNQNDDESTEETEANYFAASLLVPEPKLRWSLKKTNDIPLIARYFGVNDIVIVNRINWTGANG